MTNDAPLLLDVTRLVWRRWAGRRPTGIDRVCLSYLDHFASRAQAVVHHRYFRRIFDHESSEELFDLLRQPNERFRTGFIRLCIRGGLKKACTGKGRIYLNIGHTGLDSPGFRAWVHDGDVRPVYFVHDLIPLTHPDCCRPGEDKRHRARMIAVLSTAKGVIGNSQATLDDLARFATNEALPYPPALVAWLGETPLERSVEASLDEERPTFIVLGTIEARKNHLMLLNIWARLSARLGEKAPRLLIIGQRGWEVEDVCRILDERSALSGNVIELNSCPDEELAAHFATARALLFPSQAEGFGLPLVESLRLGVPVIASALPVFDEIGQGVPLLLDRADEAAWEEAIIDFSQPVSASREEQLRRLSDFRAPTWNEHLQAVDRWLATIGSDSAGQESNG